MPELKILYVHQLEVRPALRARLTDANDALSLVMERLTAEPVEVFGALCLTTRNEVIGYHEVSRGCLNATIVHPREVFKAAVMKNASSVIVAHNHPSGDPRPSPEDVDLTRRLQKAGELLGISLLDHIIIGHDNRYFSFRNEGML